VPWTRYAVVCCAASVQSFWLVYSLRGTGGVPEVTRYNRKLSAKAGTAKIDIRHTITAVVRDMALSFGSF
jgi:hypothetical protein